MVVAGESLVDVVVPTSGAVEHAPGGSPMNVAVGLARLGLPTLLLTEIGEDDNGRLIEQHVHDSGVELHGASLVPGRRTSTATAHLDAEGSATYDFDLSWELAQVELPVDATALHVGSVGALLRPGREAVVALARQAVRRGLLVSYDPNARPALTPDAEQAWDDVRQVAALAGLVKMSVEDLEFLCPGTSPTELAAELLSAGTSLFVLTGGGEGATAFTGAASATAPSYPVQVVDTVGAGDSFMAALVAVVLQHGLTGLDEHRLSAYLTAAHQVAQITVSRRGADPPRRTELPATWPGVE